MARVIKTVEIPLDKSKTKEQRRTDGIRRWCDFYRQNPHRFISTHLGCETLTWWQDMIIYLMFKSTVFFAVMCRGIGKSFLAGWFMVAWCILYPRTRIVIASGTRGQSRLIITQKVLGEIYNRYPKVRQEIDLKSSNTGMNDTFVKFYNGSEIVVITGTDSSRGNRAMIVLYEESRTLPLDIIKNVLSKMKQNGERRPRYKDNPKYSRFKAKEEQKKDIHISSGWFQQHHFYEMCNDAYERMLEGLPQYVMSLHWGFPVSYGFMDYENDILVEKKSSSYSKMWWAIENEGMFWSESDTALFGHQQLTSLRKISNPLKPIPNELYLDTKELNKWKKKNSIPKQKGEIRLLSADVAVMGGNNDNTVFLVMRLIPHGNRYMRYVSYIEHASNAHSESQSIRLKQLYNDMDIDFVCLDCMGNGMGVFDASAKTQYDTSRDMEYPAWTVFNREDMVDRVFETDLENAEPIVYGIKQDAKFNHFMITWLRSSVENERIELLLETEKARDELEDKNLDENVITKMLASFYETDLMIKECTALEVTTQKNSPYLKVDNPTMRKDRFSALGFANYYANELEQDLNKKTKKKTSWASMMFKN